ncbi:MULTISPECIES: hypothetical protein [unclassified Flavobacterium]|uniref:hypothetical protein n=1 Tax=unclassified Flavobacterium TaxID=196869 RepID=UPI000F0C13E5|nr:MULTISPECIES: hypothetical protein [unclassified Flavobacterium]AYN04672.1 hypothetical protein EAG11_11225 [Flavobacterium sp. 140616W15]MCD0474675.1 hypothetical protein [Flavobacterium sp. EDS]
MKTTIIITLSIFCFISSRAQQIKKDSIFFEYDSNYIRNFIEAPTDYYLKDSSGGSKGAFFFKEVNVTNDFKNKNTLCLKKFIRASNFYDKKEKLQDYKLTGYFDQYVIFLVRKKGKNTEYIQVEPFFSIE